MMDWEAGPVRSAMHPWMTLASWLTPTNSQPWVGQSNLVCAWSLFKVSNSTVMQMSTYCMSVQRASPHRIDGWREGGPGKPLPLLASVWSDWLHWPLMSRWVAAHPLSLEVLEKVCPALISLLLPPLSLPWHPDFHFCLVLIPVGRLH